MQRESPRERRPAPERADAGSAQRGNAISHTPHVWLASLSDSPRMVAQRRTLRGLGMLANSSGSVPVTQLFRKKGGEPLPDMPPLGEMSVEQLRAVKAGLDEGTIKPESKEELDVFLGIFYGSLYENFPTPLELARAEKLPYVNKERTSENAGSIFSVTISGRAYFVKKMKSARGALNEALVPFFAILLGLVEHSMPTVAYQIDDEHFAVTPMLTGKTGESEKLGGDIADLRIGDARLLELFLFDYLVGSYDRIAENVFIDSGGEARLIDNEGSLGLSGRATPVKSEIGAKRIGFKSAFLAAFLQRLGVKPPQMFGQPFGKTAWPEKLRSANLPKEMLSRILNVGDEMLVLMTLLKLPAENLTAALDHLKALSSKENPTVVDVLDGKG